MLTDALKESIREAYTRIKDGLPGFRARPAQTRMIAEVARALSQSGGAAVIEAPTGTGKSMAYLIAGAEVARAQKKKLLIATATVALQEQLVERDIPLYLKLNGSEAKVAIAKGRGRYLCPRNLRMASGSLGDSGQMGLGFDADLALWSKPPAERDKQVLRKLTDAFDRNEWNGDMDAAPETPGDMLRAMITTSAGGCTGRRCAQFMVCPFFAARRAVADADIIVANQDLVLSDLTMPGDDENWGGVILPKPDDTLYVFDEAHHMPGKTIDRGASDVPLGTVVRQISRLGRQVHAAYSLTDKEVIGKLTLDAGDEKLQELSDALEDLEREIRQSLVARSRRDRADVSRFAGATARDMGAARDVAVYRHVRDPALVDRRAPHGDRNERRRPDARSAIARVGHGAGTYRSPSTHVARVVQRRSRTCTATGALGHAFKRSATRLSRFGRFRRRVVAHDSLGQRAAQRS